MTDREKSSERFLERWSRKKIEAERETPDAGEEVTATPSDKNIGSPEQAAQNPREASTTAAAKPQFDLASLPSLDSITASTDIRAFLAPGVPKEIARAALRRAWAADPAIRDFVGLAENAWDFTAPDAIGGFGELPPDFDVKKLVARIFGEDDKEAEADSVVAEPTDAPDHPATADTAEEIAAHAPTIDAALSSEGPPYRDAPSAATSDENVATAEPNIDFVRRDNNIALHNSNSNNETDESKKHRPHGGALPQ